MLELNKVYNIDAINGFKEIPDDCIDLIITDPPYKLNKTTGSSTSSAKSESWQGNLTAGDKTVNIKNTIKFSQWMGEVYRVLKQQSHFYVFVNDKNLVDLCNEAEKVGFKLHNILVWKKNNCTPNRWYMKNCEFILFFHKGKSFPINNLGSTQLYECNNISGKSKIHPTQKPLEYIDRLIKNSSDENDIVFDPFCGSGTTLVSAIQNRRNYIGFEIDKSHYITTLNRINNTIHKK